MTLAHDAVDAVPSAQPHEDKQAEGHNGCLPDRDKLHIVIAQDLQANELTANNQFVTSLPVYVQGHQSACSLTSSLVVMVQLGLRTLNSASVHPEKKSRPNPHADEPPRWVSGQSACTSDLRDEHHQHIVPACKQSIGHVGASSASCSSN